MCSHCALLLAASLVLLGTAAGQEIPFIGQQEAKLNSTPPTANSLFGSSLGLSGNTAVFGAWHDDIAGAEAGAAYVFVRNGTTWTQQAMLRASDAAVGDLFGLSVGIFGDTSVVGSYAADTPGGQDSGAAYVFLRTGTNWSQKAKLTAGDAKAGDSFGYSVALLGDTVVVGAPSDDHLAKIDAGSAYVFVRSGTTWSQQAKLTPTDVEDDDFFGTAVALSGDTLIVGAEREDQAGGSAAGAAYVFVRSGTTWAQQAKLMASDGAAFSYFGNHLAISEDTAIVGATGDSAGVGAFAGAAYIFVRTGKTWAQQTKLTLPEASAGDAFGGSVAIRGDLAVVGAPGDDNGAVLAAGSVHIYTRDGTDWGEQTTLVAPDPVPGGQFGSSAAIEGDTVITGAPYDAPGGVLGAGSVYVFRLVSIGTWSDLGLALAGTAGLPLLESTGYLVGGLPVSLSLAQGKSFSFSPLVVGVALLASPFKGGTMVPSPDFIFPLFTDFFGSAAFGGLWPSDVPSGFTTYFQWWIQDPAGPKGFAASNALAGTTP